MIPPALNPAQRRAVEHTGGPAIVLAGAGSGKTAVLTARAQWLLQTQAQTPESLLLATFTNKAAGQMRERIVTLTGQPLPFVGTFHSLAARLLRRHATALGISNHFVIYDKDDQETLLKRIIKQTKTTIQVAPSLASNLIGKAKQELLSAAEYQDLARGPLQESVAAIYHLYQQALRQNEALDFDDLLLELVKLLKNNAAIRQRYQSQFQHVLVDEYQDTNRAQYELSLLLAQPQTNIFVVGDFAQSIYSWRGADYRNMMRLYELFPKISEYKLEQNYRSTQTILSAASAVIARNQSHPILSLWTEQTDNAPIEVALLNQAYDEARHVVSLIRQEQERGTPLGQIAVLYRINAQSRAIEESLLAAGIAYVVVGGTSFYERKEVKDVLSMLRLLLNPADSLALERIEKIGKKRATAFSAWLESQPDLSVGPSQLIEQAMLACNYQELFNLKDEDDLQRLANIGELRSVAENFTELALFLENVALVQQGTLHDAPLERSQKVQLMSLHAAKGLEFRTVIMVGMEEGVLPHSRSVGDVEQLEEERRLCYVGMTRAKRRLCLTLTSSRMQFGTRSHNLPSRFLREIPPELLDDPSILRPTGQNSLLSSATDPTSTRRLRPVDDDLVEQVMRGEANLDQLIDW